MQPKRSPFDIPGNLFDGHRQVASGRLVGMFVTQFSDTNHGPVEGASIPTDTQFIVNHGDLEGMSVLTFRAPGMKDAQVSVNRLLRAHPPTYDVELGTQKGFGADR